MTDDCTRNGGRLLRGQVQRLGVASQFVTMVMGVFAPLQWQPLGRVAAIQQRGIRKKRGTKLIQEARGPLRQASLGRPV
ncbi:MAG TPA: hypothetical protein VIY49_00730 [Bryobacteraceae bacterium]